MDIIIESVKKLERLLLDSGCDNGGVLLDVDPDAVNCRYENGACMTAEFGGKKGVFATFDPLRCCTKISFMFGAPLDNGAVRCAACAIINVASGFFCLSRTTRPCDRASHTECGNLLVSELTGKQVYIHHAVTSQEFLNGITSVNDPASADIILIGSEGLIAPDTGDLVERYAANKRIICIGPSTTGVARLHELGHWCPFGTR